MDCRKIKKEEKGITLIALVITIIVLLILAGVSIAMLTGRNGILNQANQAKEKTEMATTEEKRKLIQIEAGMNLEEKEYTDKNEEKITIPSGMVVSSNEGENEIKKGLVAIDKNGNEWVWIGVPKSVTQSCISDNEIETVLQEYAKNYRQIGYTDNWQDGCGLTEQEYMNNKSKMLQSIKENGGFWIGRYEVGTDEIRISSSASLATPFIQQDKYPYNWITCGQAEELASQLNPDGKRTATLMYGIQWDLVCKFIEEKGEKTQADIKTDSTTWGNYSNATFEIKKGKYSEEYGESYKSVIENYWKQDTTVLLTVGSSERNKALNIYDLAGNEREWTLEKNTRTDYPLVSRGGYYEINGTVEPASYHRVRQCKG